MGIGVSGIGSFANAAEGGCVVWYSWIVDGLNQ